MGQKINPRIIRMSIVTKWPSKWFSKRQYALLLKQDVLIRKFIRKKYREAGISRVEIERTRDGLIINIKAMRPGIIIGRSGAGIEELKKELTKQILNKGEFAEIGKPSLNINILEVKNPNLDAQLVLENMIMEIEKRIPYRRVMKQTIAKVQQAGAKGVKVLCKGRLNGVEIAREEKLSWGRVPLSTFRADIDYARGHAQMSYGKIGIKVWIYRGEVFKGEIGQEDKKNKETAKK